jgi:hypothetical protein
MCHVTSCMLHAFLVLPLIVSCPLLKLTVGNASKRPFHRSAPIHDESWIRELDKDIRANKDNYPAFKQVCLRATVVGSLTRESVLLT